MKIGILTLPLHTNYGGILQAYALQTVLERMGHEVTLIDRGWPPHHTFIRRFAMVIKDSIRKILHRGNSLSWHWIFFREKEIATEHALTFQFVDKYINRKVVPCLYSIRQGDYDGFVVGSDQIWREHHFRPIENAFLDFAENWPVKRVSYAASFGTDAWEYSDEQTYNCLSLIQKFDGVSVREKSAVNLCKRYLKHDAIHVLDPTMLLLSDEYVRNLGIGNVKISPGNFLVYILDMTKEKQQIIDYLSLKYNLTPFVVNSKCEDRTCPLNERVQPPVEKWLRGFYDAKFVFTDSFHACAFAINFNKAFFVYGNRERGLSRFESLLQLFDLSNRMIQSVSEVEDLVSETIDWNNVNKIILQKRKKSIEFLQDCIKS